jgi:hypothetical protein
LDQGEQRNKWQGPAVGGKDAVYAGCELEPTRVRASALGFAKVSFSGWFFFRCWPGSAVQSFGPLQRLLSDASCRARFKLLSAGAGSKHGDLCNEQIRDSNERFNLCLRVFEAQAQDKRAPLLPKHSSANERLKGVNFSFFAGLALIS